MATDNWPVDFQYVSTRLTTEIVQQHEAALPRRKLSLSLQLKLLGLTVKTRAPDYRNRFDLASRATEAVADLTGTVEIDGDYILAELDVYAAILPVHLGWRDAANVEIAALIADTGAGTPRTFVALIGSASNFLGRNSAEPSGWCPSDLDGLYEILDSALEARDPALDPWYLSEDARHDDVGRVEAALTIGREVIKRGTPRRLEVLARPHYQLHDVTVEDKHFSHVIIGAPIWAATPQPRPLSRSNS